ncbi:hypothetical protein D3C76_1862050 [compost metagenome]
MQMVPAPAAVNHVLPDNQSEPVAMIVPPGGFDFNMLPHHVEAEPLHGFDIISQCLVTRSGI